MNNTTDHSRENAGRDLHLSGLTRRALPADWRPYAGITSLEITHFEGGPYDLDLRPVQGLQKLVLKNIFLNGLELPGGVAELVLENNGLEAWPESLGALENLRRLHVENQALKQLPGYYAKWKELESLTIRATGLTKLPAGIGMLNRLKRVDLSRNRLGRLPVAVTEWSQLERLELAGNRLKELPGKPENWPALQHLDIGGNRVQALPSTLARSRLLRRLYAGGNGLGPIPAWIGEFGLLAVLDWSGNSLTRIAPALSACRQIEELRLCGNALEELPDLKTVFPYLKRLDLSGNRLAALPLLPDGLKALHAGGNFLGVVPAAVLRLTALEVLRLDQNQITEPPANWGELTRNLRELTGKGNPGKWAPEVFLPLRQLTRGEGFLRGKQWEQLLKFMELARMEQLPEHLSESFFQLFRGKVSGVNEVRQDEWYRVLAFPVDRVHQLARKAFLRTHTRKPALGPGKRLYIWGQTWLGRERIKLRLDRLNIAVETDDPSAATHCLMGRSPLGAFTPSGQVFLSEQELVRRICRLEKATLYREKDKNKLAFLGDMLLSPELANRELAWRMLWEGGVPAGLMETLKASWESCEAVDLKGRLEGLWRVWGA